MARIRTIKPAFFTAEDIVSLSLSARLLYIALWCEADREGRLEWKPKTLKLRYLPADSCDIEAVCAELIQAEHVKVYEVEGKVYAWLPTFKTHQVINNRESKSTLPAYRIDACPTRADACPTRHGLAQGEGKGRERKGREENTCSEPVETPASEPAIITFDCIQGKKFHVYADKIKSWDEVFPAVDVLFQLKKARQWIEDHPTKRKTIRGMLKFCNGWLSRAQDESWKTGPSQQTLSTSSGFDPRLGPVVRADRD